jgi:hypothetical protein
MLYSHWIYFSIWLLHFFIFLAIINNFVWFGAAFIFLDFIFLAFIFLAINNMSFLFLPWNFSLIWDLDKFQNNWNWIYKVDIYFWCWRHKVDKCYVNWDIRPLVCDQIYQTFLNKQDNRLPFIFGYHEDYLNYISFEYFKIISFILKNAFISPFI